MKPGTCRVNWRSLGYWPVSLGFSNGGRYPIYCLNHFAMLGERAFGLGSNISHMTAWFKAARLRDARIINRAEYIWRHWRRGYLLGSLWESTLLLLRKREIRSLFLIRSFETLQLFRRSNMDHVFDSFYASESALYLLWSMIWFCKEEHTGPFDF